MLSLALITTIFLHTQPWSIEFDAIICICWCTFCAYRTRVSLSFFDEEFLRYSMACISLCPIAKLSVRTARPTGEPFLLHQKVPYNIETCARWFLPCLWRRVTSTINIQLQRTVTFSIPPFLVIRFDYHHVPSQSMSLPKYRFANQHNIDLIMCADIVNSYVLFYCVHHCVFLI